ncbi:MAG: sodium:alanine symporter family protein [Gammaproteobacteria bacterium]|nr:MAG: sodium:alanine symporter family protein [Gammaproteobacteria bacterium]
MEHYRAWLEAASALVWGPPLLVLLVGTGLYLTLGLRFYPLRRLGRAFRLLWQGRHAEREPGDLSPFNALMTALAATVGTGNIAGVATAIALGGPGAVFWMWVTALVGMATKYAEAVLAVTYREVDVRGCQQGGPMYYIRNGLGRRWAWLGFLFALFGTVSAFGIGNTIQANSVAHALENDFGVARWITALALAGLTWLVLVGGVRRLGEVAGRLVPFMALAYVASALLILVLRAEAIPAALHRILHDAFTGSAATGGFAGAGVMLAIRYGVARGVFSNEAGLGTAPIAHAAARTRDPVRQGTIAMLGTFIDTLVICTLTALVILVGGGWTDIDPVRGGQLTGAALTAHAFEAVLPGTGAPLVAIALALFAYTTLLGWSYYGERCAEYLFGPRVILPYRLLWVAAIPAGAVAGLQPLWLLADVMNGLMALPNLVALLLLSPVVFRRTRQALEAE